MSDTSPRIDLSAIWNRLAPKEPVPFQKGMVIPSEDPCRTDAAFAPQGLVCQIKVYYPAPVQARAADLLTE